MRKYQLVVIVGLVALAALPTVAQDQDQENFVSVMVAESEEYGAYLTDTEGMSLYLFVDDLSSLPAEVGLEPMTEGVRPEAAQCVDECLSNWPPLLADEVGSSSTEEAEGTLDVDLLYIADVDGRQQVVYNGWPLYYFANDTAAGDVNGHGAGDRWFLVSPEGHVPGEGAEAETGDEADAADGDEEGGDEGRASPDAPEDDPNQPGDEAD